MREENDNVNERKARGYVTRTVYLENGHYFMDILSMDFIKPCDKYPKGKTIKTPHKLQVTPKALNECKKAEIGDEVSAIGPHTAFNTLVTDHFHNHKYDNLKKQIVLNG